MGKLSDAVRLLPNAYEPS